MVRHSRESLERRAPWVARAALAAIVALPLAGALGLTSVGSFRMFSEPTSYDLDVTVIEAGGAVRYLPSRELAPHLSPDAARVLFAPAERAFGETHVELAERGMDDLGALACALRPGARSAVVILRRRPALERGAPMTSLEVARPCAR